MARGNRIVVSADPRGKFEECYISGTPSPGTVMEMKQTVAMRGGRWTFEPAGTTAAIGTRAGMAADGDRVPVAVLMEDYLNGRLATTPYADGERGFLYWPAPGEELNMLLQNQTGTADDFAIGDKLIVDDGTGKLLISAGTPEAEPFIALEAVTDMTVDTLIHTRFTAY